MTLVEVVISVVLLSLITGAVAAAFITGFNGVRPSQQRVRESNDAQVIASFLVRDAQSAGGSNPNTGTGDASLGVSSPGTPPDCTGPSGTVLMRFVWREYTASATSKLWVANYYFDTSANTIVRRTCVDGAYSSETQLAGFVASIDDGLGHNNKASCIAANGSEAPCPTSPAATLPDRVRVRITETNEANAPTPYRYALDRERSAAVATAAELRQLDTHPAAVPRRLQCTFRASSCKAVPTSSSTAAPRSTTAATPSTRDPVPTSM